MNPHTRHRSRLWLVSLAFLLTQCVAPQAWPPDEYLRSLGKQANAVVIAHGLRVVDRTDDGSGIAETARFSAKISETLTGTLSVGEEIRFQCRMESGEQLPSSNRVLLYLKASGPGAVDPFVLLDGAAFEAAPDTVRRGTSLLPAEN